jgi:hypothetical protein
MRVTMDMIPKMTQQRFFAIRVQKLQISLRESILVLFFNSMNVQNSIPGDKLHEEDIL